jgi:hypothetical protein
VAAAVIRRASLLKHRVTPQKTVWINRSFGLVIIIFGLVSLYGLV